MAVLSEFVEGLSVFSIKSTMTCYLTKDLLDELASRNSHALCEFEKLTSDLSPEQWNWKPASDSWSMAQITEHLVITNGHYLEPMSRSIGSAPKSVAEKYKSSWIGDQIVKRLEPAAHSPIKPAKAPKFLLPANSKIDGPAISARFQAQLEDLHQVINAASYVDMTSVKVPLSFTKLLKMKIGDVLRFIVAHNDRHLLQMQRLRNNLIDNPKSAPLERP